MTRAARQVALLLACAWIPACAGDHEERAAKGPTLMEIQRDTGPTSITGGEVHVRDVELEPEEFLHVLVVQKGVDVYLELRDPSGEIVGHVDSPNGRQGPEELLAIAEVGGRHRVEIVASGSQEGGDYTFETVARRPATEEDRALLAADRAYHHGRKKDTPRDAIEILHQARTAFHSRTLAYREAATLYELCRAHQALQEPSELPVALAYCDQAAELFQDVGDRRRAALSLDRAGFLHVRLDQVSRAVPYFDEALRLFEESEVDDVAAECASRLAGVYRRLGDFRRSLDFLDRARAWMGTEPSLERAVLLNNLGEILLTLNLPDQALDSYREAADLHRQLEKPRELSIALRGVAEATMRLDRIADAKSAVGEALAIHRESPAPRTHALTLRTLARIRRSEGDLEGAREAVEAAIELLSRQNLEPRIEGYLRLELGYLRVREGRPEAGLAELDRAWDLISEPGEELGLVAVRTHSAQALGDLGRLEEAWERIAPALDQVEGLRGEAPRRDHRTAYFAGRQSYFEIAIEILMRRHEREPEAGHHLTAFEVHERRLARELRDILSLRDTGVRHLDPALRVRERSLERRLSEFAAGPREPEIEEQIDEVLEELRQMWAEMGTGHEEIPPRLPVVDLEQVRTEFLDDRSLLLVYVLGEERGFLWAISRQGVEVHDLAGREALEALARSFTSRVATPRPSLEHARRETGRRLADALLGDVADRLGERRLVLVPDGALQAVPFAALPEPAGDDDTFLVERHEIVVVPSLSTLTLLRRTEAGRPARRNIAAFGDPVFSADDPRVSDSLESPARPPSGEPAADPGPHLRDLTRAGESVGFDPFERLPHAGDEVRAIVASAPSGEHFVATDFAASRASFLDLDAANYRVLHFATHAVSDPEHPELSGIVLSLIDEDARPRPGYLRAFEISRLDLPVELVTLSGCQTGAGKVLGGEGTLGLARSFLDAGATRVLASLWSVSDRHTARLMDRFYEAYLHGGQTPAAALRTAQLEMLENPRSADPYAWAAFVVQGDWQRPERSDELRRTATPSKQTALE